MSQAPLPPPPPPPSGRDGCLQILAIFAGLILMLPGVCAVLIVSFDYRALNNPTTASAVIGLFAIAAGGVALMWWAVRRPR